MITSAFLGIDLGGTKIAGVVMKEDGQIFAYTVFPTPADKSPGSVFSEIRSLVKHLRLRAQTEKLNVEAVGITIPGPFDVTRDLSYLSPNIGWQNVRVRQYMEKEALPVFFDNDAICAAIGEMTFGAARGIRNFIYTTVSTGVGSRIVINGHLLRGVICGAGETGHIVIQKYGPKCGCGNRGCVEAMASGPAIARKVITNIRRGVRSTVLDLVKGDINKITARVVAEAAHRGDKLCCRVLEEAGRYVGMAMAAAINVLNPEMVVVGGGVARAGIVFLGPMKQEIRNRTMPVLRKTVRVVRAKLGSKAEAIGAAQMAKERVRQNGSGD